MAYSLYFVNETKKQIVSSKKLYCDFEQINQLSCYLSQCEGDIIRILGQDSTFIEDFICEKHQDYKYISLFEYNIKEERYKCSETERLLKAISNQIPKI